MSRTCGHFWDRRADEDAFFFVDNRLRYRRPDLGRFWSEGERDLAKLLGAVGAAIEPSDNVSGDRMWCRSAYARALESGAASVRALDVSARMLTLAQRHNRGLDNVEWVLGDGRRSPRSPPISVDACVSHVVFQHIPDPEITLVLRPRDGTGVSHGRLGGISDLQ